MKPFLFALGLLSTTLLFAQNTIYWSPPIEVNGSDDGQRPRIHLLNDGTPAILFSKYSGTKHSFFTKWNGADFNTPTQLTDAAVLTYDWGGTEMSVSGDNVYVVFKEDNVTTGRVYIRRSSDGGDTWGPKVQIEDAGGELAMYPNVLGGDSSFVLVTYMVHENGGANPQYIIRTSTDYGATFSPLIEASEGYGDEACYCCPSSLAMSDDVSVLLFRNDASGIREMKVAYSTDNAATFDNYTSVDDFNWFFASCPSSNADMQLVGSTVYATYMSKGEGDEEIYLVKDDLLDANPFEYKYAVNADTVNTVNHPSLTVNGDTIIAAWQQSTSTGINIWYNFSLSNMAQWDKNNAAPVFESTSIQTLPDLVIDDNSTIHLVYRDENTDKVMYTTGSFTSAGFADLELMDLKVSPNPASDFISLSGVKNGTTSRILDVNGKVVLNATSNKIDVSSLSSGTYFVETEGYKVTKFVVR